MAMDKKLINHLFRANGVADECPSCKNKVWRFAKNVVSLPYVQENPCEKPIPSLHMVPIICNNCGYIRLFLDKED